MFTPDEQQTIEKAIKSLKKANYIRVIAMVALFAVVGAYSLDTLSQTSFFALLATVVVVGMLAPHLGFGPKYDELALLLHKKLKESERR
ncbi:hypothetical protein PALB_28320 [Pseudoalteromonas luteoviolacea B = ATCC 29581]|nr:hypothetical protein PALB_28320 [Pseudoalteromonas luteoviolacea B = ATCC 29581]